MFAATPQDVRAVCKEVGKVLDTLSDAAQKDIHVRLHFGTVRCRTYRPGTFYETMVWRGLHHLLSERVLASASASCSLGTLTDRTLHDYLEAL